MRIGGEVSLARISSTFTYHLPYFPIFQTELSAGLEVEDWKDGKDMIGIRGHSGIERQAGTKCGVCPDMGIPLDLILQNEFPLSLSFL